MAMRLVLSPDDIAREMGIPSPRAAEEVAAWEQQRTRDRQRSALREACCPDRVVRLWDRGQLDDAAQPVVDLRARLVDGWEIVLLEGPPGTGKTVAACCAILDARNGYYVRADRLAQVIARAWDPLAKRQGLICRTASPLVIDDVGCEVLKDAPHVALALAERYDEPEVVTIMTTNLTRDQFRSRYGERTVSRINHVGRRVACAAVVRPVAAVDR